MGFCSLEAFGPGTVLVDARRGGIYARFEQEAAELIGVDDPRLKKIANFVSPHPELVQKRIQLPLAGTEKSVDACYLSRRVYEMFLEKGTGTFELNYISSP
jgi:hypothetical protein